MKEYLQTSSQPFNINTISETWINTGKEMAFELEGYELKNINRKNKGGGGVAIYIDKNLNYKILESTTTVVDNLLECLTIEICNKKNKNVIVSCIYRTPGINIDIFRECIEGMFSNISNKVIFICGDFNTDILNPHEHRTTDEFINTMHCLLPKITRPTGKLCHFD